MSAQIVRDNIEIPTVYQRVEYLESTADGRQYMKTNIVPTATSGMKVKCASNSSNDLYIAGQRNDTSNTRWLLGCDDHYYFGWGVWNSETTFHTGYRNTVELELNYKNSGVASCDDEVIPLSPLTFQPERPIFVFGSNTGGSLYLPWVGKIYDLEITEGSNIVMHLIPCYRKSDGKPGMWDTVGWKFYENAGSGADFIIGPDVVQPATKYIVFEDRAVEAICVQNFSSDGRGVTMQDAAAVTSLNQKFRENTSITKFLELVYFTSLTEIGPWEFYLCSNLAEVGFPPNATSIIFRQSPLTAMYVTESLDKYLARETRYDFEGSRGIHLYLDGVEVTQITFPQSITSVPAHVLSKHKWITSINIPDTVTSIGNEAFSSCAGLTSILVPSVATLLSTFYGCTSLENAVLKEGTTTIGVNTFRMCGNLARLELPSTITSIDNLALAEISHLTIIIKAQTPPTLASNVWNVTTIDAIYVPYSADHSILDAYKIAQTWSGKASVIHELNPDGTIPS